MARGLVLSIFPGIDLLGRAFEEEGYTVVRGPDPLWGGDIRGFHPPAGVFEGVIGGPPCQHWTRLMFLNKIAGAGKDWVVNEYARVVEEAQPAWFLMEEVIYAPMPLVAGYHDYDVVLRDNQVGGVQPRERRFTFGTPDYRMLNVVGWEQVNEGIGQSVYANSHDLNALAISGTDARRRKQSILADGPAVPVRIGGNGKEKRTFTLLAGHGPIGRKTITTAGTVSTYDGHRTSIEDACEAQGLPREFTDGMPFTKHGKQLVLGNGVPRAMGLAVARAIKAAFP